MIRAGLLGLMFLAAGCAAARQQAWPGLAEHWRPITSVAVETEVNVRERRLFGREASLGRDVLFERDLRAALTAELEERGVIVVASAADAQAVLRARLELRENSTPRSCATIGLCVLVVPLALLGGGIPFGPSMTPESSYRVSLDDATGNLLWEGSATFARIDGRGELARALANETLNSFDADVFASRRAD